MTYSNTWSLYCETCIDIADEEVQDTNGSKCWMWKLERERDKKREREIDLIQKG